MPAISSVLQNFMLKIPMDLEECSAFSTGQEIETAKQPFPRDQVVGKLVCFFCNEEFEGVDVLHFHQRKCSSVCDIQTVLANSKSNQSKKRRFLSQLSIISKAKAEHLRLTKRHDVVVDVIVIDDSSDDEEGSIIERKSLRYLQTKSNNKKSSNRNLCSGRSSSNGPTRSGKFLRQPWKVFKFDITSPLGMRFRYHDSCEGASQLPHYQGFMDYERYCCETVDASESLPLDRNYPITFRKTRHLKYTHRYKFTRRQLQETCAKKKYGLSVKSRKLKRQMKPCSIELKKLVFCLGKPRKIFDVTDRPMPPFPFASETVVVEEMTLSSDNVCELEDLTLFLPAAKQARNSTDVAVDCETSTVNGTSTALRATYRNSGFTPPICSVTSRLTCPEAARTNMTDNGGCRLSFGNVRFVPLSALCEQTFHDRWEREHGLCQISSVFSLAVTGSPEDIRGERCDAEESTARTVENTDSSENNLVPNATVDFMDFEPTLIQETVMFDAKSCDFPGRPASRLHHPNPNAPTEAATPADACPAVIDLTEPLLQFGEIISDTVTRETRHSTDVAAVSDFTVPIDDVVDSLLSAGRCEIQYSQTTTQVAAKPIVIEIPDEDTAIAETACQDVYMRPSDSLTTDCVTMASSAAVSATTVGRHSDQTASSCLLKQVDNILNRLLCDNRSVDATCQSTVQPKQTSSAQSSDLIDLSADSDCELMGIESLTNKQSANTESLGLARSRPSNRSLLGSSPLPPLTFRCHICHCLFEFSKDCGTLIKNHYLNHNVTNIELIKHRHPNGKVMWSLVEVNDGSALTLPPHPANDELENGSRGSALQPTMTMRYPSPMVSPGDANSVNNNRSTAVSQTPHLGSPLSWLLLDENPHGSKGGAENNFVAKTPHDSKSSASFASGDGGLLQSGSRREQRSKGHSHARDARFQLNSLAKTCRLPQPEFQEPSLLDCDIENTDSGQASDILSTVPKAGIAKDPANTSRGKLLQRKQDYNSFGAYNNFAQSVICLD